MPSLKTFFLASLTVAGVTNAATCKGDYSIESDGDASKLTGCDTVTGSINIGTGVVNFLMPDVQVIQGDLTSQKAVGLLSISAPSLRTISGTFQLQELTILQTLSCPQLSRVGTITWVTLPSLKALEFTTEVTQCNEVLITDTELNSLDGINLSTARLFNINNNRQLKTVTVGLGNVTEALSILDNSNNKNLDVSFPDLVWATNITITHAKTFSAPNLAAINSSCALGNNGFSEVDFPALTQVGQSLSFNNNDKLTNITAPKLTTIGGTFQIANNTQLKIINGFPAVTDVGGSIDFSGSYTNASLPSLDDVRGGLNAQTTAALDCTQFDAYHSNGVVKGDEYKCEGKLNEAKSTTGGASTTGGGGNGTDGSSASRAGVSMMALLAAGAAVLIL